MGASIMPNYISDSEVFGSPNYISDDEVFGVEKPKEKVEKPGILDRIGDTMNSIRDYATGASKKESVLQGIQMEQPAGMTDDVDADTNRFYRDKSVSPNSVMFTKSNAVDATKKATDRGAAILEKKQSVYDKAEESRDFGQWASDAWNAVNQGVISTAQLPLNIVAPDSLLADSLRSTQDRLRDSQSDVMQAKYKVMRDKIDNEEGFLDKYVATVASLVTDPSLGIQEGVKQLPNFIGVLGMSKFGKLLAEGSVSAAGAIAPGTIGIGEAISGGAIRAAAGSAGAVGGGVAGSMVMSGGDAAGNTYEELIDPKKTPLSAWQANPDYQKLIANGVSSDDAIKEIATAKARMAAIIAAPLGLLGYSGAEASIISRSAGSAIGKQGFAKIFGKELAGENLEEGATQLFSNAAIKTVNTNKDILDGVAEAMGTATVVSAPTSGIAAINEIAPEKTRDFRLTPMSERVRTGQEQESVFNAAAVRSNPIEAIKSPQAEAETVMASSDPLSALAQVDADTSLNIQDIDGSTPNLPPIDSTVLRTDGDNAAAGVGTGTDSGNGVGADANAATADVLDNASELRSGVPDATVDPIARTSDADLLSRIPNVQDAPEGTETQAEQAQSQATAAVGSNAAAATELPGTGASQVQANGVTESKPSFATPSTPIQSVTYDIQGPKPIATVKMGNRETVAMESTYPTQESAMKFATQAGIAEKVEVHDTGNGFALLPKGKGETVGELRRNAQLLQGLSRGIAKTNPTGWDADGLQLARAEILPELHLGNKGELEGLKQSLFQANILGRIAKTAFGTNVVPVVGLPNSFGVQQGATAFVDIARIAQGDGGKSRQSNTIAALITFTVGHEVGHTMQKSSNAADRQSYQNFRAVVLKYTKAGVVNSRALAEGKDSNTAEGKAYAEDEVVNDANGAMWVDPKFWGMLYDIDKGSTMRRVAYKFMQAATTFMKAAKGSRLDTSTFLTNVEEVRKAAATAWAEKASRGDTKTSDGSVAFSRSELGAFDPFAQEVDDYTADNVAQTWGRFTPRNRNGIRMMRSADGYVIHENVDDGTYEVFDPNGTALTSSPEYALDDAQMLAENHASENAASAREVAQMQAELRAEQDALAARNAIKVGAPTKEDIDKAGISAEEAIKFDDHSESGSRIEIKMPDFVKARSGSVDIVSASGGYNVDTELEMGRTFVSDRKRLTKEGAIKFAKRQVAAEYLHGEGHDLASVFRKGTIQKIATKWLELTKIPGAFKYGLDTSGSANFADVAQSIGVLNEYNIRDDGRYLNFAHKTNGSSYYASMSRTVHDGVDGLECCTMGLAGGDIGSTFYTVAAAVAKNRGKQFFADRTLSVINSYRRTEQALSFALKTGDSSVLLPGPQNRVYGYDFEPKTKEDHYKNIARLAIANLRNVQELIPDVRRWKYDGNTDTFTDSRGNSIEDKIDKIIGSKSKGIAGDQDVRALGIGRSTLARAVLTNQIINNDEINVAEFAEPVAYSLANVETMQSSEIYGDPAEDGKTNISLNPEYAKIADGPLFNDGEKTEAFDKVQKAIDKAYDYAARLTVKFDRMKKFHADRAELVKRIDADANAGKEAAIVMRLISRTGFRIGGKGETKGEPTFGATSLRREHVSVNGDTVTFDFRGKSGVRQYHSIIDHDIARDLQKRMSNDKLFAIGDSAVRRYHDSIRGDTGYKVHDHRTWNATDAAQRVVDSLPNPKTQAEFDEYMKAAITAAATKIGDDYATAKQSYVDPQIFDKWREGLEQGSKAGTREGKASVSQTGDEGAAASEDGQSVRDESVSFSRDQTETPKFKKWFGDWDIAQSTASRLAANFKEARTAVSEFQGKPLINLASGISATVSRNALDKMLSEKAVIKSTSPRTHVVAVANLDALFQRAELGWSKDDREGDSNIKAVHRFFSPLIVDGRTQLVKMTVKETVNPDHSNPLYTVESVEFNKNVPAAQWVDAAASADGIDPTSIRSARTVHSLAERVQNYKPDSSSKVVDADGNPLVVYHGTGADFSTFDNGKGATGAITGNPIAKYGFFFSDSPSTGSDYADNAGDGANVMPTFLSMAKPYEMDMWNDFRKLSDAKGIVQDDKVKPFIEKLKRQGYDGIILKGGSTYREFMVFEPTQIKSAIGNNGEFDGTNPDISYSRAQPSGLPEETRLQSVQRVMQDKYNRIKLVQDILLDKGGKVDEEQDVYRAEERMHGRVHEQLREFADTVVKPLIDKAVKYKIDLDELATYAYAKHAAERNAHIQTINQNVQTGSGMSDAEAANIIQLVELSQDKAKFEELHNDLLSITATTRRVMLDEGLITQDQYDAMEKQYENYVPLRGFEDVDPDKGSVRPGLGRGFNVKGAETIKAMGRDSKAGDIIENIIRDYERTTIRSERNSVGKTFLDLVTSNPEPKLWEVQPLKRVPKVVNGLVEYVDTFDKGDETIVVKVSGREVYIKINDPLLLRAMQNTFKSETSDSERFLMKNVGKYTSLLRNTITRYNPAFGFINAVRDSQMGAAGIYDELGAKGLKLYMKNYASAVMASGRTEFNKSDPIKNPMDKWMREMRFAGGTTGGVFMRDHETIRNELRDAMLQAGVKPDGVIESIRGSKTWAATTKTLHMLELIGSMSENSARLSAYATAREMGKTPAQAATIAKNLTVNFNRFGEQGQLINTLYLFYNASVQGSVRIMQMMQNKKVRYAMAGMASVGMGLAFMAAAVGGDDEDGQPYWDKIPDFEKERNLIIMLPPGTDAGAKVGTHGRYIKIPMAYGLNVFPVLGYNLADMIKHAADPAKGVSVGKAAINVFSAVAGSYNPMGGAFDPRDKVQLAMAVSPTIVDAGIQLGAGVDSFGRPLGPQKSPYDKKPDSEVVSAQNHGSANHKIARWLNSVTGGNQARSGAIDIEPGTVKNVHGIVLGGLGKFIGDVVNLGYLGGTDAPIKPKDIPIFKSFYGEYDSKSGMSLFYERSRKAQEEFDDMREEHKLGIKREYSAEEKFMQQMGQHAKSVSEAFGELKKQEVHIAESNSTEKEKEVKRRQIQLRREKMAEQYNQKWYETEAKLKRANAF